MIHPKLVLVLSLWGALALNRNSTELPRLRLVGGDGRCRGVLQVQGAGQGAGQNWTGVMSWTFPRFWSDRLCVELGCGHTLAVEVKTVPEREAVSFDPESCADDSLIRCFSSDTHPSNFDLELNCSESVRLVGGWNRCSGSLQIRDQSLDQSWAGVCEGALDHQGAEVLCRELRCGAPLLLGAPSPLGQTFHCEGNESSLMDCPQTRTHLQTCSTLQLSCTDLRLVGGTSRCEGTVELQLGGQWQRVTPYIIRYDHWGLQSGNVVCRDLDCGTAVFTDERAGLNFSEVSVVRVDCMKGFSSVRDCVFGSSSPSANGIHLVCSELLNVPQVSVTGGAWSPRAGGGVLVREGRNFSVSCYAEPQYPGGSFRLFSPTINLTEAAVNHSAHFLFTEAGPAHEGNYTCVYHVRAFDHDFSANSSLLICLRGEFQNQTMILVSVLVCVVLIVTATVLTISCKRRRDQRTGGRGSPNSETEYANVNPESPAENIYQVLALEAVDPTYGQLDEFRTRTGPETSSV